MRHTNILGIQCRRRRPLNPCRRDTGSGQCGGKVEQTLEIPLSSIKVLIPKTINRWTQGPRAAQDGTLREPKIDTRATLST